MDGDGEHLDFVNSKAWAMADHQLSHIFVQDSDPKIVKKAARLFNKQPGIAEVLTGEDLGFYAYLSKSGSQDETHAGKTA